MGLPNSTEHRVGEGFVRVFVLLAAGVVAAAIGLLALLGWFLKWPLLASFEAGLIPMAPSTAVLFVLYGAAVCLRARQTLSRRAFRISVALVGLGTMVALLLFTLGSLNIHLRVEHLGLNLTQTVGQAPIGHMSPVTAFCFLLASLSFLASLPPVASRPWLNVPAFGAAGLLAGTGFIFLLAYLFGAPLLYGGVFIPPALNTILAFAALSVALLTLAGRTAGLFDGSPADGSGTAFLFALIFVFMTAGIVSGGYLYYRNYERQFRSEAERQISVIEDLKVSELTQYRKERLWDASIFLDNPAFSGLARRLLEHPQDAEAQQQIQQWAAKYLATRQYDMVCLLDDQGVARLSVPARRTPMSALVSGRVPEVLRSGQLVFQDFHRNEHDQQVYLTMLVPILDGAGGGQALGVLAMRISPETYLYPFIKRWPVPSESAETLLIRREGNEAVFLNELRFRTNTALALRISMDKLNVPAVNAALGQTGIVEGVDYRGVPVIAAVRAVPDSPWFMVAKMDTAEMFAPLRERLRQLIIMTGILIFGVGAGLGLFWRQQRVRFYQARLEAEEARARLGAIVEFSHDAIIGESLDGVITSWNLGAEKIYGYSAAEAVGRPTATLILPGQPEEITRLMEKVKRGEAVVNRETGCIRKDGEHIQVSLTLSPVKDMEGTIVGASAIGCDITEQKRAGEKLQRTLADLERSNKELEQFAYVASHDLQEPLRMVSSYTQLLARRFEGQLDDKSKKYIAYAVDGAIRMKTLINDLLAYSRVATKGQLLESTDSHAALGEALRNLAVTIEETRAIITNGDLPVVRADGSQLVLLFQNLLSNAIKFQGKDLPHIHVSAQDKGGEWLFAVKDDGIGIEPRHAERVFVIFQRLHTREEYPGTGIGLAVCKRVVERHGGRIWFESQPGNGTTFFFTIPK